MIDELRIYWKLRPTIKKLKGLFAMRLSVNVVSQILLTIAQGVNALEPMVSPAKKPVIASVIGVIQAVIALLAHYQNPDGTPAAEAYVKKAKPPTIGILLILGAILAFSGYGMAQTLPDQGIAAVIGINQYAEHPVQGSGTYFKLLAGPLYALSTFDVTAIPGTEGQLLGRFPQIQFQFRPGLWLPLLHIGKLHLGPLGEAGMATTGSTTGASWGGGGLAVLQFKGNWGIIGAVRFVRNNVTGTQTIPEFGFAYGR